MLDSEAGSPQLHDDETVRGFIEQHGQPCAMASLTGEQHLRYHRILAALYLCDWKALIAAFGFVLSAYYVAGMGCRLVIVLLSLPHRPEHVADTYELAALPDADLPVHAVLLLYPVFSVAFFWLWRRSRF